MRLPVVNVAQRFLVTIHTALAAVFLAYLAMIGRLFVEDVSRGSVNEGTQAGGMFGAVAVACVIVLVGGIVLWQRTGKQRYAVAADLFVVAPGWTLLSVLLFFDVRLWVAALGLTLLCLLVALVVPPPARKSILRPRPRQTGPPDSRRGPLFDTSRDAGVRR